MECKNPQKSLSPQIFLEDFKKRDSKANQFFYGFGRCHPINSFLFKAPKNPSTELFCHSWWNFPDSSQLSSPIMNGLSAKVDSNYLFEKNEYFSMFSCAAEIYTMKISPSQSKCTICNFNGNHDKVLSHIIENHSEELSKFLEPHSEYIDDDTEYMTGMLTKLQFDNEISLPKKYQNRKQQFGLSFTAPVIDFGESDNSYMYEDDDDDDDDEEYEEDEMTVNSKPNNVSSSSRQKQSTPSSSLSTTNAIPSLQNSSTPKIDSSSNSAIESINHSPIIFYRGEKNAPLTHYVKKHRQNLSSRFDMDDENQDLDQIPPPATLFMPFLDFYLKSPQKTNSKQNNLNLLDDLDLNDYQISNSNSNNNNNNNNDNNKRKSKQPEMIPYIQTIPSSIRATIIANLAKKFISNWASSQCLQIVKPLFHAKKKLRQKKLRDEKLTKARNEERQKLEAMRERRKISIDIMSKKVAEPLIRSFIRHEIEEIYKEVIKNFENQEKTIVEEVKEKKDEPPPFILYTKQKINLIPTTKNIEKISIDGGKMINNEMLPIILFDD